MLRMEESPDRISPERISRRRIIKRGAAATAGVWTAPVILRASSAQALGSPPPCAHPILDSPHQLVGAQEVPPNASPGTGTITVSLDKAQTQLTVVQFCFSGLVAPATAAHIHGPAPRGTNAPVIFPMSGVPNLNSGCIPTPQSFAIGAVQVSELLAGLMYANVHSTTFPGGEIRGQLDCQS